MCALLKLQTKERSEKRTVQPEERSVGDARKVHDRRTGDQERAEGDLRSERKG